MRAWKALGLGCSIVLIVNAAGARAVEQVSHVRCAGSGSYHNQPAVRASATQSLLPPISNCDDGTVIDIMIVFTAQARAAAGGTSAMTSHINQAVAEANAAFSRSQISTSLRLVFSYEVNYAETGNFETDTARLVDPSDGYLDDIPPLRDQYGADCLSFWGDTYNFFGFGYYPDSTLQGVGVSGLTLMDWRGYEGLLLAHEVGHNLWCAHDRAHGYTPGYAEYSNGYVEPGNAWQDIMAAASVPRIPYYANPNVSWPGPNPPNPGPTGVSAGQPNSSDIALTINQTRHIVANFRATSVPGLPSVLYVKAGTTAGGDGLSWGTAFRDLQDALCRAAGSRGAVQQLWVAAGTYKPDHGSGDRSASFHLRNNLALYGGFAGTETSLDQRNWNTNVTILSGDISASGDNSDNSYHVVRGNGNDSTARLDGFQIMGGNADAADFPDYDGGGMRLEAASPNIAHCTFRENNATNVGGGVENINGAEAVFTGCSFDGNTSTNTGGGVHNYLSGPTFTACYFNLNSSGRGGGLHNQNNSAPTLTGCYFRSNFAQWGGGMLNSACSPTLTGCTFLNQAINGGGALENDDGSSPKATDCHFDHSSAAFGGGVYNYNASNGTFSQCMFNRNSSKLGSGMYNFGSSPRIIGCTFRQNNVTDDGSGGGVWNQSDSAPTIVNCTFDRNTSTGGAAGLGNGQSVPTVRDCTFIGNVAAWAGGVINAGGSNAFYVNCNFFANRATTFVAGGMENDQSSPTLVNCLFSGNQSVNDAGGLGNYQGSENTKVINCTFSRNSAGSVGGGIALDAAGLTITNTVLWGNSDSNGSDEGSQLWAFSGTPTINRCTLQGWTGSFGGTGNNGNNPLFIDADGADNAVGTTDDNCRTAAGSPAIDTGDSAALPADGADLDDDTDAAEPTPLDLDRHPRILGNALDRGAYEFVPVIPGDSDHDGDVDANDVTDFSACQSGPDIPYTGGCGQWDFDHDNDVDLDDFGVVQRCISGAGQPANPQCGG